jgi:hypothetical protein
MVIRVAAADVEGANLLVDRLAGLFDSAAVSLQADAEVQVRLNGESGQRAMARTLACVERWLGETGLGFTDVWVDERQYRMEPLTVARSGPTAR